MNPRRDPNLCPEAERALLGACFLANRDQAASIAATVQAEDIHTESLRWVFRAWLATECGDAVQVLQWLKAHDMLDTAGGAPNITSLPIATGTAANWKHYADIVADHAQRRRLVAGLAEALHHARSGALDAAIDSAGGAVARAHQKRSDDATWTWRHALKQVVEEAQANIERRQNGADSAGWTFGDPLIDKAIPVFLAQVTVIGAAPKSGKTDIVCQGTLATAANGVGVLAVSVEMNRLGYTARTLRSDGAPHELAVLRGDLTETEYARLFRTVQRTADYPIYPSRPGGLWTRIEREIRARVAQHPGIRVVVLDYLQLVRYGSRPQDGDSVGAIAKEFAEVCRDLNVAGVLLSQLNRAHEVEKRAPNRTDLRQSGQIEEAADRVRFLWRPNRGGFDDFTKIVVGPERWEGPGGVQLFDEPIPLAMQSGRFVPATMREER